MEKAWEVARRLTDGAVPRILSEEEQTWEANIEAGEAEDFHLRLLWNSNVPGSYAPESIMLAAIQATENRGFVVEGGLELWKAGQKAVKDNDMPGLNRISSLLWNAVNNAKKDESHPSWSFKRHDSWDEYKKDAAFLPARSCDRETLKDRMLSGWTGQIVGGAVGTMIEGYTSEAIEKAFGDVQDYLRKPSTYNDDITYEIAFLRAFEEKGRKKLTSKDVAQMWIALVPSGWSAEEMALRNIRWGIMPPESGRFANPFGEWIGAQMRGAVCGQLAPGDPEEAARLAWLDGEVSHYHNGIIGEIFNATLVSMAFVESDIRKTVEGCVSMLPSNCEYSSIVRFALDACKAKGGWRPAWAACEKLVEKYNWIHAYPNAAAEVVALWFGEGDFDATAHIISMEGQDADCNAAQILTVVGTMAGTKGIPKRWTDPIGDELKTYMRSPRRLSIRALAERTAEAALS